MRRFMIPVLTVLALILCTQIVLILCTHYRGPRPDKWLEGIYVGPDLEPRLAAMLKGVDPSFEIEDYTVDVCYPAHKPDEVFVYFNIRPEVAYAVTGGLGFGDYYMSSAEMPRTEFDTLYKKDAPLSKAARPCAVPDAGTAIRLADEAVAEPGKTVQRGEVSSSDAFWVVEYAGDISVLVSRRTGKVRAFVLPALSVESS